MTFKSKELDSVNILRKEIGLKPIRIEKRKCMRCDEKFETISRNICSPCRQLIAEFNMSEDDSYNGGIHKTKVTHYIYGNEVYASQH